MLVDHKTLVQFTSRIKDDTAFLIKKSFVSSFKFHSNLFFKGNKMKSFPSFCRKIFSY